MGGIFDVFRVGKQLANPAAWKQGQITASAITTFIMALVNFGPLFGVRVDWVTPDFANALGTVVLTVVGVLLVPATSTKVGLLPAKPEPSGDGDSPIRQDLPDQPSVVEPSKVRAFSAPVDPFSARD